MIEKSGIWKCDKRIFRLIFLRSNLVLHAKDYSVPRDEWKEVFAADNITLLAESSTIEWNVECTKYRLSIKIKKVTVYNRRELKNRWRENPRNRKVLSFRK